MLDKLFVNLEKVIHRRLDAEVASGLGVPPTPLSISTSTAICFVGEGSVSWWSMLFLLSGRRHFKSIRANALDYVATLDSVQFAEVFALANTPRHRSWQSGPSHPRLAHSRGQQSWQRGHRDG